MLIAVHRRAAGVPRLCLDGCYSAVLCSSAVEGLASFTTERAGGTEAINGIIELHRRPRLSQPGQLSTTDDLDRRESHPPESPMSCKSE